MCIMHSPHQRFKFLKLHFNTFQKRIIQYICTSLPSQAPFKLGKHRESQYHTVIAPFVSCSIQQTEHHIERFKDFTSKHAPNYVIHVQPAQVKMHFSFWKNGTQRWRPAFLLNGRKQHAALPKYCIPSTNHNTPRGIISNSHCLIMFYIRKLKLCSSSYAHKLFKIHAHLLHHLTTCTALSRFLALLLAIPRHLTIHLVFPYNTIYWIY